ncbi:MAG: lipopolysaccharide heptosyltransferase II [Bacillota bacterium]
MKPEIKAANRIVVIDLLYMGDLIFATPFLRNLRTKYPNAQIDLVLNANFADLLADYPHLDQIYAYDKAWSIWQSISFARELAANNYDLGLNLHGNWRTAILLKLINPDYSVGYGGKGRGIWLDQELTPPKDCHMVEVYLDFLYQLGFNELDQQGLELVIKPQAKEQIADWLANKGVESSQPVVGLNTGGSWETKRWLSSGFAELADTLLKRGYQVIFLGGPSDRQRVQEIVEQMGKEPFVATGQTNLPELAALVNECDLVISGDSGPVHVAAAVQTPTITIFGPSDEVKYQPYQTESELVTAEVECRPCGEQECPLGHHRCMQNITVDDILEIVGVDKIKLWSDNNENFISQ